MTERCDGSQTGWGEIMVSSCHMTSASRAPRSKGHVITILLIHFLDNSRYLYMKANIIFFLIFNFYKNTIINIIDIF